jgi:hypothetical protein
MADPTDRPRPRGPRRQLLNLGIPFAQVDDFLNQSENAVALGYQVLVETVEEIRAGYDEAKRFKERREQALRDGKVPPGIEWEAVVDRAQRLQDVAFRAMKGGSEIFFESLRAGTDSIKSAARTAERSRRDGDSNPVLAGPVFPDPIVVEVQAGTTPEKPFIREYRHRGLARLRIIAVIQPKLQLLSGSADKRDELSVASVTFEPTPSDSEEMSSLKLVIGPVPSYQAAGVYEGLIRAQNFELLIAKLRVEVKPAVSPPAGTAASTEGLKAPRRSTSRAGAQRRKART